MSRQSMRENMSRLMEHQAFESPYQQFQQEYPALDEYGRDVVSGRRFEKTVGEFGRLGRGAIAGDPQAGEEFINMFGFGAMAKPARALTDVVSDLGDEAVPDIKKVIKRRKRTAQPRVSREEAEQAGYWHPVGGGKRLQTPYPELSREVSSAHDLVPFKPADFEAMQGGRLIVGTGDRTEAGKWLHGVGGTKLSEDVLLEGGHGFMRSHDPYGSVWASDKGVITSLNKKAQQAIDEGVDPYLAYMPMGHTPSNFNTMMSDALLAQMHGDNISKTAKKMFDREMRKLRPEWAGIDDPLSKAQLDNTGAVRHAFVSTVQKDAYQKRGFPDVGETRFAITDPALMDVPLHQGGQSFGKLSGEIITDPVFPHTTDNTQLGGSYAGGYREGIPRGILFPEFEQARRLSGKDPASDPRSFDLSKPTQDMTQEWLDGVMKYIEGIKAQGG